MTSPIKQLAGWQGVREEAKSEPVSTTYWLCELQYVPEPLSVLISKTGILLFWVLHKRWGMKQKILLRHACILMNPTSYIALLCVG